MILLAMLALVVVGKPDSAKGERPPGNYHSGHFFFQDDILTNQDEFGPVPLPMLLLSVSRLEYHTPFSMRINRTLTLLPSGNVSL